ncbi:MAG: TonB family protein [Deltaproteobacteria bacterium]|nr:TonB family protein [Deltaproteobacteria bacterium]
MRWDSPFVLATAGTIAIHLALITAGDAFVVFNPVDPPKPAPRIEVVDIEPAPVLKPPPPPPPLPEIKQPEPEPVREERKTVVRTQVRAAARAQEPPATPVPVTDPQATGGEQVVQMENVAPSATGVGVAIGKRSSQRVGRGGSGGGTGAGSGSGAEVAAPMPTSVATIKKRAMPKGDFGYWKAGKDYPAEAKQLGIEGKILVRLVVDETGKVRSTTLVSKLGHGLDELALARAKDLQFEPAIDTDNRPVSSVVVWTFDMTLPK